MRLYPLTILLILSLLPIFACSGEPPVPSQAVTKVQDLIERVTQVITEEERQKDILKLADKMEKQVKKLEGLNGSTRNKVFKTYKNPKAVPEDFDKILKKHSEKRMKAVSRLVALRMEMRQLVSKEEWDRLAEGLEFVR